jgi:hypothetical protein
MAYQYAKDHDLSLADSGALSATSAFVHKLTGVSMTKPRHKTAFLFWRHENKEAIDAAFSSRVNAWTDRKHLAGIRNSVVSELFNALPKSEKAEWEEVARREHEEATAEWTRLSQGPPSSMPGDRQ